MADFSFQPSSFSTFARSATFPRSGVFVARERVRQVIGHLSRSSSMASMLSKEDAHDSEVPRATAAVEADEAVEEKQAVEESPTSEEPESVKEEQPSEEAAKPAAPAVSTTVNIDQDVKDILNQLPELPNPLPEPHPDFIHCMPPTDPTYRKFSVFTAGSIEMGKAVQWQTHMAVRLSHLPITVNNPRRGHWDPAATPTAKDKAFRTQVDWELDALEQADVICFFFDVTTLSPITLLELGLWAASEKIIVCCGEKYWRVGNVQVVCERYNIPCVKKFDDLPAAVEQMLKSKGMELDAQGNLIAENVHTRKVIKKKVLGS